MVEPLTISHTSQSSTTDVTKGMVCAILSVGWCTEKITLLLTEKNSPCDNSGFPL